MSQTKAGLANTFAMNPVLRKTVLREWRGLDYDDKLSESFSCVSDLARAEFEKLGMLERFAESAVTAAWREVVGDFIANHSRPVALQSGVLVIHVLQPTLRYELDRFCKKTILAKLASELNLRISDICFKLS